MACMHVQVVEGNHETDWPGHDRFQGSATDSGKPLPPGSHSKAWPWKLLQAAGMTAASRDQTRPAKAC